MSELISERIRAHAEHLRLTHLAENAEQLIARAEEGQLGYREFLDLALEEELGVREGRRFACALKLSGLPHHKGLDEFDFAFQPQLDARKVRDLATLTFVGQKGNVCLLGPPGVGKTHIAVGLAIAACQAGFSVYFTSLDDMVRNLREAEATGRFAKKLQTYLKPAVLVLDEVGYLPLSRAEGNMVFQLVSSSAGATSAARSSSRATRPSPRWARSSAMRCSPQRSSTACCITPRCSRSTDRPTDSRTGCSSREKEVMRGIRAESKRPSTDTFRRT